MIDPDPAFDLVVSNQRKPHDLRPPQTAFVFITFLEIHEAFAQNNYEETTKVASPRVTVKAGVARHSLGYRASVVILVGVTIC